MKSENDFSGSRGQFLYHLGAKHRLVEMFISLKEIEAGVAVKDEASETPSSANETPSKDNPTAENEGEAEVLIKDTEVDELLDSASTTQEAPLPDEDEIDEDAFKTACEELSACLTPQRKK